MNTNRQTTVIQEHNKDRNIKPTASNLIRWAGLSAMVAGIFYVVVGLFRPLETLSSATTPRWIIVHALATAMCFFGLLGMAGLYARQVKAVGWLGLAGYLLLSLFFALTAPYTFAEAVILPLWAATAPTFVEGLLGLFNGHPGEINLGVLAALYSLSGIVYIFGGLLFGFATFRAGILPRWAAGLPSGPRCPPWLRCFRRSTRHSWRCRWGSLWPGWAMCSGRNGASTPRKSSLARAAPSSAQLQPSKVAGKCMAWTSGHMAACRIGYAIVTRSIATDGDNTALPGPLASERAVKC